MTTTPAARRGADAPAPNVSARANSARSLAVLATTIASLTLAACASAVEAPVPAAEVGIGDLPTLAWEDIPQGDRWTEATMLALEDQGAPLLDLVPADIATWCPGYADASEEERAAFWAGLLSALAEHESTWNPRAVGGGGRWFGLVQIAPATARAYGCAARTGSALQDGADNLACAVRIMARTVLRDGVVAANRGGLAADWGPFTNANKRAEMAEWTRTQPFCAARTLAETVEG